MSSYLLKRLFLMIYTLIVASLLVFSSMQLLPADAATTLLGQNATPEALVAVRARLGLDVRLAVILALAVSCGTGRLWCFDA